MDLPATTPFVACGGADLTDQWDHGFDAPSYLRAMDAQGIDFFFSSRRRHTSSLRDWSSDVCSSDLRPPRRPGGLPLLGRDEHRPGPGRGGGLGRGGVPAAGQQRRLAAPVRARRVRATRRDRGARGRRRAGTGHVRLRHAGLPAGRRHHRPGQRLRGRGQARAPRRGRHRRRGRPDRGGDHRRRHRRPPARRRRPGRPGRARRARRVPARHHRRHARRQGRRRARRAGRRHPPPRAGTSRPQWPVSLPPGGRPGRRARRQRRLGARAPGDPDQGRGQAGGPGDQRGRGIRRPLRAGLARGLPGRLESRAAHRRDRAAHQRPVRVPLPAAGERDRVRPRDAGRHRAAYRRAGRRRRPGRARRGRPGARGIMTKADTPPVRADLNDLTPYGAPQIDVPVRLNTNENPYPPSPALVRAIADAVAEAAASLNRYPDRDAVELRKDLADYLGHGLTGAHLWAANGSNEVIQQVQQAFGGPRRRALGFDPGYSMHSLIARVTCTGWISAARDEDFGLDPERAAAVIRRTQPDIVFLTSPNNPTGTAAPMELIEAVCAAAPGLVVIDEAYAEFAREGTPSALTLLPRYPGLVVTRTMSKAFAMAGARIGYLAAAPEVVEKLLLVRLPYHLSAVTQAVARAALALAAEPLATVAKLRTERDGLVAWLRQRGLSVADSDANFVLFGEFESRRAVWQGLLDRGVLVREVGPPRWLRVTVGTPDEMAAFRAALDEVLSA